MTRPASAWGLSTPAGGWWDRARCSNRPDIMQPEPFNRAGVWSAKKFCHGCPVRVDCLTHALAAKERAGVWGGMSETERRKLAAGVPLSACKRCGITLVPHQGQVRCYACSTRRGKGQRTRRELWQPEGPPTSPSAHHRLVLELRAAQLTVGQIARRIGASEQSVKSYLRRHYKPAA